MAPAGMQFKDKRRAIENLHALAPVENEPPHPTKRPARRAETRQCPVCEESIPLRLLAKHAEVESERVDAILNNIGSSDVYYDELDCHSRTRRSAIKARKTIVTRGTKDTLEQTDKTIQTVKRRRKQRHAKLKEMAKEEEEGGDTWLHRFTGKEIVCPVCCMTVRGDQDIVDAHVDACLAHEHRRQEEIRQRELQHQHAAEAMAWDDGVRSPGNYVGNLRGVGFHARNPNDEDVQDEIDIERDDQALYGEAQFSEGDVVHMNTDEEAVHENIEVNITDGENGAQTLRDLVAAAKVGKHSGNTELVGKRTKISELDRIDNSIALARERRDKAGLLSALHRKINHLESKGISSPAMACRICLDSYTEPTTSTGCWHTCCRECWLRCLGSTKLCPICKRITCASDLRRIYL